MDESTCLVDGCERPAQHGRMCYGHRNRVRHHGDPLAHVPLELRVKSGGPCTHPGCAAVAKSRNLCPAHYQQARKRARGVTRQPLNCMWVAMQLSTRPRADACWTDWIGASVKGRPVVTTLRSRKNVPLARYVRYLEDGVWPIFACHHCDNPACWNPDHIYAGDPASNVADMLERGRHRYVLPRANNMHLGPVS